MWPVVERAIDFVLDLQTPRGEILWARHADGTPWSFALLTGSSSICHSLRCAIALAELLGHERPDWELSAARLTHVIRHGDSRRLRPQAPLGHGLVLPGAHRGDHRRRGRQRLAERHDAFVVDGCGVRCVSTDRGSPVAETCEYALANLAVGDLGQRRSCSAGPSATAPTTGATGPAPCSPTRPGSRWASGRPTPASAVVLAADALPQASPASGLFTRHDEVLPALFEADADAEDAAASHGAALPPRPNSELRRWGRPDADGWVVNRSLGSRAGRRPVATFRTELERADGAAFDGRPLGGAAVGSARGSAAAAVGGGSWGVRRG